MLFRRKIYSEEGFTEEKDNREKVQQYVTE